LAANRVVIAVDGIKLTGGPGHRHSIGFVRKLWPALVAGSYSRSKKSCTKLQIRRYNYQSAPQPPKFVGNFLRRGKYN
jgi:hypothetical protein